MYIEYKNPIDKESAKSRIDTYIEKLNNLRLVPNFKINNFNKSWTKDEMQVSFNVQSSVLDRRVQGVIKVKDDLIIIDSEMPTIINNFITDENLEKIITNHLGIALSS